MHWYKHHIGDWARDTAHLSILESGAYAKLIAVYYRTENPLPSDISQICKLSGCRTPQDRNAVKSVIMEFFTLESDGYHQKRCDEEIAEYRARSDKARQSVRHRWDKLSTGKNNTNVLRSQYERHTNQEPTTRKDLDPTDIIRKGQNGQEVKTLESLQVNIKSLPEPRNRTPIEEHNRHIAELLAQGKIEEAKALQASTPK